MIISIVFVLKHGKTKVVYGPDLLPGLVISEGAVLDVSGSKQLVVLIRAVQIVYRLFHRYISKVLRVHPIDKRVSERAVTDHHITIVTLQDSPRDVLGLSGLDHGEPGFSIGLQGRRPSDDPLHVAGLIAVRHSGHNAVSISLGRLSVWHPGDVLSADLGVLSVGGADVADGPEAQVWSAAGGVVAVQFVIGPDLGRESAGGTVEGPSDPAGASGPLLTAEAVRVGGLVHKAFPLHSLDTETS